MNYFEHHIGDYDQATAHLSAVEDGIYHRLIRLYMAKEKPLSADVASLQRLVRAHTRDEKKAVETVLSEFFELCEDGYHQHRCDEEIARFKDKSLKAKRSAEARWSAQRPQSEGNADAYANASLEHTEGNAPRARPQTPYTSNTPLPPAGGCDLSAARPQAEPETEGFKAFWDSWPKTERKQARGKCAQAWRKGKCEGVTGEILQHVEHLKRSHSWLKDNGQFVPAPLVYLNGRRWEGAETDAAPSVGLQLVGGV